MIQALSNLGNAAVVLANFQTDCRLSNARQHQARIQCHGTNAIGHGVAFQRPTGVDGKMQPVQAGRSQNGAGQFIILRQLLQTRGHIAADFLQLQIRPRGGQLRLPS